MSVVETCSNELVELNVTGCFQIMDQHLITIFARCPKLKVVQVGNCRKLTDEFLNGIVSQQGLKLRQLDIGGNFNITDDGVRNFIKQYRHINLLEELSLSGLPISDETILLLSQQATGLRSLGLSYLDLKESTILTVLQTLGKQLEKLDMSWPSSTPHARNTQVSAVFLVENIPALCPMLTHLDLTANRNLTLPHVQEIIERKLSYQVYFFYASDTEIRN